MRNEPVLVVGGGVIADIAGFALALFHRNTPYVVSVCQVRAIDVVSTCTFSSHFFIFFVLLTDVEYFDCNWYRRWSITKNL